MEQEGADEAAGNKDDHREDVAVLRGGFGEAEFEFGVLDDEGPTHDLRADVEGLRDHTPDVGAVVDEALQGGGEVESVVTLVGNVPGKQPGK